MFNFVSKSYVKEINRFLEGRISKMKVPAFHGNPLEFIKGFIDNQHGKENDVAKAIVSHALNELSAHEDSDDKFNDGHNRFRDFKSKKLFVYNAYADPAWPFAIGKFNGQNDEQETKWFARYVLKFVGPKSKVIKSTNEAIALRKRGGVLLKCSTTTLNNEKYMIANYTIKNRDYCSPDTWTQKRVSYCKKAVNDKFDVLFIRNEVFPIRGFVRYDSYGKNKSITWLNEVASLHSAPAYIKDAVRFASTILSYFVKGACMAMEGEYRHIIINNYIFDSLALNEFASHVPDGSYSLADLPPLINNQYKSKCLIPPSCEDDIPAWLGE